MSRVEETGMRTGVLGLDPRTHLASFLVVGVAAMLVIGLLETALLQAIAAAYLTANGRQKLAVKTCASFAAVCALSFLPLPGLYGVLFVSILHMVPPFTVGCALLMWQHLFGQIYERIRPASLNPAGAM